MSTTHFSSKRLFATSLRPSLFSAMAFSSAVLAGCFTGDFDENAEGAYSCDSDTDCSNQFVCSLFRCVSDLGPSLEILSPEPDSITAVTQGEGMTITVRINDLELSKSAGHTDGDGFVELRIDDDVLESRIDAGNAADGITIPISAETLANYSAGAHHIRVQVKFGDGFRYPNPSASGHRAFFIDDGAPHVGIMEPGPGSLHLAGRELAVKIGAINFDMVIEGDTCTQEDFESTEGCEGDPANFDEYGHAHMYLLDDFPSCLNGGVGGECSSKYVTSVRPKTQDEVDDPSGVHGSIPGGSFPRPGITKLSTGLQYNNHKPYVSPSAPVFDQFEIEIIKR